MHEHSMSEILVRYGETVRNLQLAWKLIEELLSALWTNHGKGKDCHGFMKIPKCIFSPDEKQQ